MMAEEKSGKLMPASRRAHMANERTFLAWIRTSIGVIAFGFAVERSAFISSVEQTLSRSLTRFAGFVLMAFGVMISAFVFIRYIIVEKELDRGMYKPNMFLTSAVASFVIAIGMFLIIILLTGEV